jgi:hypothetical protein
MEHRISVDEVVESAGAHAPAGNDTVIVLRPVTMPFSIRGKIVSVITSEWIPNTVGESAEDTDAYSPPLLLKRFLIQQ